MLLGALNVEDFLRSLLENPLKDIKNMKPYKQKKLDFGSRFKEGTKYAGEKVIDIIERNPSYIRWLQENTHYEFTPRVLRSLDKNPVSCNEMLHYRKWAYDKNFKN